MQVMGFSGVAGDFKGTRFANGSENPFSSHWSHSKKIKFLLQIQVKIFSPLCPLHKGKYFHMWLLQLKPKEKEVG